MLIATRNAGKLRELRGLLDHEFVLYGTQLIDLQEAGVIETPEEDAIEAFETFEENAKAKSEYFFRLTGYPTFADDSGLSIAAFAGTPGVRTKRWSGRTDLSGHELDTANNDKLVAELLALPDGTAMSPAEYVCAAAFTDAGGTVVEMGRTAGHVSTVPVGTDGFGYDPFFYSDDLKMHFGEADMLAKSVISHRGRAFTALLRTLRREGRLKPRP